VLAQNYPITPGLDLLSTALIVSVSTTILVPASTMILSATVGQFFAFMKNLWFWL
jgi:hypothetical protein